MEKCQEACACFDRIGDRVSYSEPDAKNYFPSGSAHCLLYLNFLTPSVLDAEVWMHSASKFKMKEIALYSVKNEWISLH